MNFIKRKHINKIHLQAEPELKIKKQPLQAAFHKIIFLYLFETCPSFPPGITLCTGTAVANCGKPVSQLGIGEPATG